MKAKRARIPLADLQSALGLPEDVTLSDITITATNEYADLILECDRYDELEGTILRHPTRVTRELPDLEPSIADGVITWE